MTAFYSVYIRMIPNLHKSNVKDPGNLTNDFNVYPFHS